MRFGLRWISLVVLDLVVVCWLLVASLVFLCLLWLRYLGLVVDVGYLGCLLFSLLLGLRWLICCVTVVVTCRINSVDLIN